MQVEYATDIVFHRQAELANLYAELSRTAIHSIKPDKVATFLGRKPHPGYRDEIGNNFSTRIEGTCIKHHMGQVAIKMYDKHGLVKKIGGTFKYYLTVFGRRAIATGLKLREMAVIPLLRGVLPATA